MPIPEKHKGERMGDFIERCAGDPVMNREYPDRAQRYKICRTQFDKPVKSK